MRRWIESFAVVCCLLWLCAELLTIKSYAVPPNTDTVCADDPKVTNLVGIDVEDHTYDPEPPPPYAGCYCTGTYTYSIRRDQGCVGFGPQRPNYACVSFSGLAVATQSYTAPAKAQQCVYINGKLRGICGPGEGTPIGPQYYSSGYGCSDQEMAKIQSHSYIKVAMR